MNHGSKRGTSLEVVANVILALALILVGARVISDPMLRERLGPTYTAVSLAIVCCGVIALVVRLERRGRQ